MRPPGHGPHRGPGGRFGTRRGRPRGCRSARSGTAASPPQPPAAWAWWRHGRGNRALRPAYAGAAMTEPGPSEDITHVADAMFDFARGILRRNKEFYPFGAVLVQGREVELVSGSDLSHPWADRTELTSQLDDELARRAAAEPISAAGVGVQRGSAVEVRIEHRSGRAILLTMPFKARKLGKAVEFGPVTAGEAIHRIFPG